MAIARSKDDTSWRKYGSVGNFVSCCTSCFISLSSDGGMVAIQDIN